jgi:hypothetical protein
LWLYGAHGLNLFQFKVSGFWKVLAKAVLELEFIRIFAVLEYLLIALYHLFLCLQFLDIPLLVFIVCYHVFLA